MKKITYLYLQQKYPGYIVALDKEERHIVAYGRKFDEVYRKLAAKNLSPQSCVFIGPIQKSGTINVY